MKDMPIVEMRIREVGQQWNAMIALHHQEIEAYINQGIDEAMRTIGQHIIHQVSEEASKAVLREVEHYFTWGAGHDSIVEAIQQAMAPIIARLRGEETT